MSPNVKRVSYFEYLPNNEAFIGVVNQRPDVELTRMTYSGPEADNWRQLGQTHVYQVTAARDDLPPQYFVDTPLLSRCPMLLAVSSNGAGYDTVDVDACTAAGVLVVNQTGGNKEGVAEHVLGLMLCLCKRIVETDRYMRHTAGIRRNEFQGTEIQGKTIGIVGLGNVGSRVAQICRGVFDMQVLTYDPYLTAEQCAERGAQKVELHELMRQSDYVSINCPRNKETLNLIDERCYALMKPTAFFITTARGGIHNEAALAKALAEKRIAGAGLDVWDVEPPQPDDPLLQFENVVASPHTAGVTHESRRRMATFAAEQALQILDGERPPRLINPEVWPTYARRFETIMGRSVKQS